MRTNEVKETGVTEEIEKKKKNTKNKLYKNESEKEKKERKKRRKCYNENGMMKKSQHDEGERKFSTSPKLICEV